MQWGVIVVVATPDREVVVNRDIGVGQSTTVAATATAVAAGGGAATAATRAGTTVASETDRGTRTVASMVQALEVSQMRIYLLEMPMTFVVITMPIYLVQN